jgi:3-methyladenine DNA glycosylase/8-oxoguanine DNA glycosylase
MAALADRKAQEFLRNADPVLGTVIDANPGFRPRAWMDELPKLDAFGTLILQIAGQQLSVASTRAITPIFASGSAGRCRQPRSFSPPTPRCFARAASRIGKGRRCARSPNASSTGA